MTTTSENKTASKLPESVERHRDYFERTCKRRSYEIAAELAQKQREQKPKSPK